LANRVGVDLDVYQIVVLELADLLLLLLVEAVEELVPRDVLVEEVEVEELVEYLIL
jgi:hypothetical protein